jgi:hypothetical protein
MKTLVRTGSVTLVNFDEAAPTVRVSTGSRRSDRRPTTTT